jgi:hypothetical protein
MKALAFGLVLALGSWLGAAAAAQPAPTPVATAAPPAHPQVADDELAPATLEKLSPDQIVEVLRKREQTKVALAESRSGPPAVAIVVPLALFVCALLLVASFLYFRHRKEREQQTTIRLMVEKGVTVPIEFLAPRAPKHSDLRHGVVLAAAGVGLAAFLKVAHTPPGAWAIGLMPLFVGVGYLIVWKLTSREERVVDRPVE